jgi:hypothetical protein
VSITRFGATGKYAAGWEKAFGKAQKKSPAPAAKPTAGPKKKSAPPKKSASKRSK